MNYLGLTMSKVLLFSDNVFSEKWQFCRALQLLFELLSVRVSLEFDFVMVFVPVFIENLYRPMSVCYLSHAAMKILRP